MTTIIESIIPLINEIKEFIKENETYQMDYRKLMCENKIMEIKTIMRLMRNSKDHRKEFGNELLNLLDILSDIEEIIKKINRKTVEKRKFNEDDVIEAVEKKKSKLSIMDDTESSLTNDHLTLKEQEPNKFPVIMSMDLNNEEIEQQDSNDIDFKEDMKRLDKRDDRGKSDNKDNRTDGSDFEYYDESDLSDGSDFDCKERGSNDEVDDESDYMESDESSKAQPVANLFKMQAIEYRSCQDKRNSQLTYSFDIPANLTLDEIFYFMSFDNQKTEDFDYTVTLTSKHFDAELMSQSLQNKKNHFKKFTTKYVKHPTAYSMEIDPAFEKLLKEVDELRVLAFKELSKKHGVIPETMPINKLLKNTRVTDTSTNMSDCYRIKTDVPKSAKCLDKNSVAKSEDITAVLMQAHMLIGEEAKIGISQCFCHKDDEKFIICRRFDMESQYEVIKGANILFLGKLEDIVKLELSVLEHAYGLGISCNGYGDHPVGKKMPSHGISNGLAIVYYTPLRKHAGYFKRFMRRSSPTNNSTSLLLALKHELNVSGKQVQTSICNFCKKLIHHYAAIHRRQHCRKTRISSANKNDILFDTGDPQAFMLDLLSKYKADSCSCMLDKNFEAQDKLFIDMYLYNMQFYDTGFAIFHPSHHHTMGNSSKHVLLNNVFYEHNKPKGIVVYHRSEMLKAYFFSEEYKDCLREILKSGIKHPFYAPKIKMPGRK